MPGFVYFKKQWWSGESRDEAVALAEQPEDMPKPKYRPGQVVQYETAKGKKHIGKIRYAFRYGPGRVDFYHVRRLKNDAEEITFDCKILKRIEQ